MTPPKQRPRRLRNSPVLRKALNETNLQVSHLIAPLFVRDGKGVRKPISSMPGQFQLSIDQLEMEVKELLTLGVKMVLLFGIPEKKDLKATHAYSPNGIIQRAVRHLKKQFPQLVVITDLCFCEYTSHGHCGFIKGKQLDNDITLSWIAKTALAQAKAGADIIAPSGMMDGMINTIRQTLDRHGFQNTLVMSYAAKFASSFYGPFREAAESAPQFGDRHTYQMNPSNWREAMKEIEIDIQEGADILMVKPALAYLDILERARTRWNVPLAAYNVSGEYSMVKAAALQGWINEASMTNEILTSIRRAGADLLITYHAKEWARLQARAHAR